MCLCVCECVCPEMIMSVVSHLSEGSVFRGEQGLILLAFNFILISFRLFKDILRGGLVEKAQFWIVDSIW